MNTPPDEGDDESENRTPIEDCANVSPRSDCGYRWECPICGLSRINAMSREGRQARLALQRHIHGTDGVGHGPKDEFPDGFSVSQLEQYVRPVDD